jgi:hypothetical protein
MVAGLLAAATPVGAAQAAQEPDGPSIGVRLVDAPVSRQDDPRAHVYVIDHVGPGDTIRRRLEVSNGSSQRQRIELYAAAATVDKAGFTFAAGRAGNELTGWVSLERTSLELAPGGRAMVASTIAVPQDASAGERYAVLWAEASMESGQPGGVHHVGRVGVRVYLSVGPGGEPASRFEIGEVSAFRDRSGVPVVAVRVRNTGGRALDLGGSLSLSDGPGGLSTEPTKVTLATLPMEGTAVHEVRLDRRLPDGPWTARLTLAGGPATRTATATVDFSGSTARPGGAVGGAGTALAIGGTLSLTAIALLATYAYRRRSAGSSASINRR